MQTPHQADQETAIFLPTSSKVRWFDKKLSGQTLLPRTGQIHSRLISKGPTTIEDQSEIHGPVSFSKCRWKRHMKAATATQMIGKAKNQCILTFAP
jgi:hypothetical protein